MRVDIFLKRDGEWSCYVQAVILSNARRIASTLESQGEHVGLFRHAKTLGKLVYQTTRS